MRHGFPPLCITPSLRSVYYDALNIVSFFYILMLVPFLLSRMVNLLYSGVSHFFHVLLILFCEIFDFVLPSHMIHYFPSACTHTGKC
jgi:hypothetical protein